jgi:hypothetical protein
MKFMGFKIIGAVLVASIMSFIPFDKANAAGSAGSNRQLQNSMNVTNGAFYNLVSVLDATYSCSDANYGEGGTYMQTTSRAFYGARSSYSAQCAAGHTSNMASSVVTASATMAAATAQTLGLVSTRIAELKAISMAGDYDESLIKTSMNEDLSKGSLGISSGDHMGFGVGVWAQGAYSKTKESNADTAYDGDVTTFMGGIDKSFSNGKLVFGLSVGHEDTELTTTFNAGTLKAKGNMIAPYISARITDAISLNLTGGRTKLSNDTTRTDTTGATVTGEFDSTRTFGAIKFDVDHIKGNLRLNGNLGGTWSREKQDAFTESDTVEVAASSSTMGQAVLGGRIGYNIKDVITPFLGATAEYAFRQEKVVVSSAQTAPAQDKLGLRVAGGADIKIGKFISARVEGQSVRMKEDYTENRGLLKLRIEF